MINGADCCLSEMEFKWPGEITYGIPIIDDYRTQGAVSPPDLFLITGSPQSYKTTIAVDMVKNVLQMQDDSCVIWVDCDGKFPRDLMITKEIPLERIKILKCKSSEDILFSIRKIDFLLKNKDPEFTTIVFDSITTSFWIDKLSPKNTFFLMRSSIERLVSECGIRAIVILQSLGDFDTWTPREMCSTMLLRMSFENGIGTIISGEKCIKFKIGENREFIFGKRGNAPHEPDFEGFQNRNDEENERGEE